LANIPAGSAKIFKTPDTNESAILVHNKDGVVTAFSSVCTHQGCDVAFNAAVNALACPCHGAQFDPKTGAATRGPANRPLKNFKVQVDASGNIVYLKA
jgi:thiosulfate dehydrogenase (quinone) large subunit